MKEENLQQSKRIRLIFKELTLLATNHKIKKNIRYVSLEYQKILKTS
jgi:hypothetical protein